MRFFEKVEGTDDSFGIALTLGNGPSPTLPTFTGTTTKLELENDSFGSVRARVARPSMLERVTEFLAESPGTIEAEEPTLGDSGGDG